MGFTEHFILFLRCRLTPGLSGAGPRAWTCKQDAPSRVHSRPLVRCHAHTAHSSRNSTFALPKTILARRRVNLFVLLIAGSANSSVTLAPTGPRSMLTD